LVTTGLVASLSQIKFGTDLKVLPRFDPVTHELEVKLEAEVTDLTPPVSAGTDLPGRNVSKLSTLVALKLGQSIVLSGIRSRSERRASSGLPLLSEIPLLGAFFGSHAQASEEVDGAIFVVPSVIESIPKSAKEIIDEALVEYEDFDGDMDELDTWEKDPARAPGVRLTPDPVPAPASGRKP
jgi:pilus assembly protein CpaC